MSRECAKSTIRKRLDKILQSWWIGPIRCGGGWCGSGETDVHGGFQNKNFQAGEINVLLLSCGGRYGAGGFVTAL